MVRPFVPVTDARTLRAMAHPLRGALYYELMARGSARAADLAQDLGVPANQVSFHLRVMARYGFIEEAPEKARDRRDRVWRPASDYGFDVAPELMDTPGYQRAARHHAHALVEAFFDGADGAPRVSRDIAMRLTAAEADQLADEISQLLWRAARRGSDEVDSADEPRQTYLAQLYLQPLPPTGSPRVGGRGVGSDGTGDPER